MSSRGRRFAVAVVASSVVAVAGGTEASANPPAPQNYPDPPILAPKAAELPSTIRKHDGGCFVGYPSGGSAKVDCPKELATEPIGQEIERDASSGKCRHLPATTWSGGSTGDVTCPGVMLVIAKPGVLPDPAGSASAATAAQPTSTGFDPPMGGLSPQAPGNVAGKTKDPTKRKDDDDPLPKASGCARGCALGAEGDPSTSTCAVMMTAALATIVTRRRRRRDRSSAP